MANASPITKRLPLELLEKILTYSSVPDILRLKQVRKRSDSIQNSRLNLRHRMLWQVNRYLHDLIQRSPCIKYQIDLFAAGLKDNPASNLTLAEKRKALNALHTKWERFRPTKKWQRTVGCNLGDHQARALGVYAFIADSSNFVEFFALESVPRAIPRREWKTQLPDCTLSSFVINPQADVLVVAVEREPG